MELAEKRCVPCEGGAKPLSKAQAAKLLKDIPGWKLQKGHLYRKLQFKDFKEAMRFVNKVAVLAESEGHHPNITIQYNVVELELYTHAIKGLLENDFILAAKIGEKL